MEKKHATLISIILAAGIILHVSKSRKKVETDKLAGMLKVGKKFP